MYEEEPKPTYNYYTTIYRKDLAQWGGKTHKRPENISRTIDVSQMADSNGTVRRCMKSMCTGCRPVTTPTSLHRDSYIPHMPCTRGLGPTYTQRAPPSPAPPNRPDMNLFRPTTEYGSRYMYPQPDPFLKSETVERCSTTKITTRSFNQNGEMNPQWNTSYRGQFCEKAYDPKTSQAVTFHTHTHLR